MNKKAIFVIGQTASGKTSLTHRLADELKLNGVDSEIINLDAFQIYKDVSIGTAKPTLEEQKKYSYHGIDLCEADETMDANVFGSFAHQTIAEISKKGKIPILVGGSGLYLRAILHGLDQFPSQNPEVRQKIRDFANENGWDKCYEWLQQVDPIRAKELHPNDHVRIERALEIFEITQTPPSELQTKKEALFKQETNLDSFVIRTEIEKEDLRKNVILRTRKLFAEGWIEEVHALYKKYGARLKNFNSMRAIGYPAIIESLEKFCFNIHSKNEDDLIGQIITQTMQYAKRQSTWNKKEKVDFISNPNNSEEFKELVKKVLNFYLN